MKKILLLALILCGSTFAHAQTNPSQGESSPPASEKEQADGKAAVKGNFALPPEKAEPVTIPRFAVAPVIDGKLDDAAWKDSAVLKDFFQIQPGDNIKPSKPTEVLIGYDATNLYLGIRAIDEPDKVRATIAKRDAIFSDDNVQVYLDTYNDQRKAYLLAFNPLGVQADGIHTEGRETDFSVDVLMTSRGVLSETGYTVEVSIPFRSLRYAAGKDKFWGVQVYRQIKRFDNEVDSWMPISRDRSGVLNQAGRITGLQDIFKGRTIELIPSLTLSETGKRIRTIPSSLLDSNPTLLDQGRFLNQPVETEVGLTAKFLLTPTATLDFAVNPDFAQVEADELVVVANQRFPIFFAEKRPFFLEGIDIFQTPLQAVHTRTIIDPDVAVKLSGKHGRNTFGVLMASDNAPGNFSEEERTDPNLLPSIERFLDKNAYIGVLRLKRDIGKESALGFIATSYNFIENHNQLGGFDGRLRLDPQTVVTFQVLGTTSRRFFFDPDTGTDSYRTGNGFAYTWNYTKTQRHWGLSVFGEGRTKYYVADVGFTRRVNTNIKGVFVSYDSEPKPKAKLISWRFTNNLITTFDWQGRSQRASTQPLVQFNLAGQSYLGASYIEGYERLFEEEFGPKRAPGRAGAFAGDDSERSTSQRTFIAFGGTNPTTKYSAAFFYASDWNLFDFDFGAGPRFPRVSPAALADPFAPLDPGPGHATTLNLSFIYQPTSALRTSIDYTKSKLTRNDTGRVAFDDNIIALNSTYQFTRFTFLRARVDYDSLASLVRGQFLVGWTPNPGTSLYIGYNNNLNYNGFNPFTGQLEPGIRRNGQTFFIKMSYLFQHTF